MELNQYAAAFQRARKRHAHATRQVIEAQSERARRRHQRRAFNAQRLMVQAQGLYEEIALIELDSGESLTDSISRACLARAFD